MRRHDRLDRHRQVRGNVEPRGVAPPRALLHERHALEERFDLAFRRRQPLESVPLVAGTNVHRGAQGIDLCRRHQPSVVVLVAGERQPRAFHRVADEAGRLVAGDAVERFAQRRDVVAAEIVHQRGEFGVAALLDQRRHRSLIADFVGEALAPCRAAGEHQRRVERVGAGVDPGFQLVAARLLEGGLLQRAVFEDDHVPAEIAEQLFVAFPQTLADHRVETLAVVVDDPPAVAQALLPAFQQRLEDVAFVHLRVAHQRNHPAFRMLSAPAVRAHIVLHQRGEQRLRHAEADRAGGEIHVVDVLGARGIGLRALEAAEVLQLLAGLLAEQILNRVKHRAGVRLHRHAVFRLEHAEIERGHDGRQRRA